MSDSDSDSRVVGVRKKDKKRKKSSKGSKTKKEKKSKKRKKEHPEIKRPCNAFIHFTMAVRADDEYKNIPCFARTRLMGEKWKAMSADEKTPYETKAREDRTRYEREMKEANGGERKEGKDPAHVLERDIIGRKYVSVCMMNEFAEENKGNNIHTWCISKRDLDRDWWNVGDSPKYSSPSFALPNNPSFNWTLELYPKGNRNHNYIALYFGFSPDTIEHKLSATTRVKIKGHLILHHQYSSHLDIKRAFNTILSKLDSDIGHLDFVLRDQFSLFLFNNSNSYYISVQITNYEEMEIDGEEKKEEKEWNCGACSFLNDAVADAACAMCGSPSPKVIAQAHGQPLPPAPIPHPSSPEHSYSHSHLHSHSHSHMQQDREEKEEKEEKEKNKDKTEREKEKQGSECTICMEPFKRPISYRCGHIFCEACMGDMLNCAICRMPLRDPRRLFF